MTTPDINETATVKAAVNAAYPLDVTEFEINVETKPGVICVHKLRKPTLDELVKREEMSVYETEEIDKGQDRVIVDDERANVGLWDKIAVSVKNYSADGGWLTVTPELAARIPGPHKVTAIRGLYTTSCEVISSGDDAGYYSLDGEEFVIQQEIGTNSEAPDYIIHHTLRQPTEGERQDYRRRASSTVLVRGTKKTRARVVTNLRAAVELYDKLFIRAEGFSGIEADKLLRHIDPMWKRQVVVALMQTFESSLSD